MPSLWMRIKNKIYIFFNNDINLRFASNERLLKIKKICHNNKTKKNNNAQYIYILDNKQWFITIFFWNDDPFIVLNNLEHTQNKMSSRWTSSFFIYSIWHRARSGRRWITFICTQKRRNKRWLFWRERNTLIGT